MPEAIGPTVVQIAYHSAYGPHTMDIPTRAWSPGTILEPLGTVPRWSDDSALDLYLMISDYIELIAPFFPTTVLFDVATVFTQATPTSNLVPQVSATLVDLAGSNGVASWAKATQQTIAVRDTNAFLAKYVFLDFTSFNNFDAIRSLADQPDLEAIINFVTNDEKAFSSRAGFKPQTFLGAFRTLNEKLRKAYRMT